MPFDVFKVSFSRYLLIIRNNRVQYSILGLITIFSFWPCSEMLVVVVIVWDIY